MLRLSELLDLMRMGRVVRLKTPDGYEVELHPSAFTPQQTESIKPAPVGLENGGEPTDEQVLFWSSGGPLPAAQQPEER